MAFNFQAGNLIVCDPTDPTKGACDYVALIRLVNVIINDLVIISTILATAGFIWAGFKLLMSGGDTGAMTASKKMLTNILRGYLIILVAWLVVYTIVNTLAGSDYSILGPATSQVSNPQ